MGVTATFEVRQILAGTLDTQLHERSVSVTRDLAARATDLVLTNDIYALHELLRDTQANNTDVRYVFLVDPQGQVIAHTFGAGFPAGLLEANGVAADGRSFTFDPFIALVEGAPALIDPNDPEGEPVMGDLLVDTELNGIAVKSGLQVIYETASVHTIEEWAAIADVKADDIIAIAEEFTSHGTRAVADIHRGPSQHTNGFYNNFAFYTLNALIGNFDHKGGLIKATTYDRLGAKAKGPFLTEKLTNGANAPFGIDLIRTNTAYEKSTIFEGYPAKRPWFPLATDVYQEDVPSMGDAYPYGIKVAMFYMSAISYSLPAAHKVSETLADPMRTFDLPPPWPPDAHLRWP